MEKILKVFTGIFTNYPLICAIVSWLIAQFYKFVTNAIKTKKFDLVYLTTSGGMPSSHTATATSLATAIARVEGGTDNIPFAIAAVICFIIMYDATGVRREAGRHAGVLNRLSKQSDNEDELLPENKPLKESLGHSALQVAVGLVFGVVIAFLIPKF